MQNTQHLTFTYLYWTGAKLTFNACSRIEYIKKTYFFKLGKPQNREIKTICILYCLVPTKVLCKYPRRCFFSCLFCICLSLSPYPFPNLDKFMHVDDKWTLDATRCSTPHTMFWCKLHSIGLLQRWIFKLMLVYWSLVFNWSYKKSSFF